MSAASVLLLLLLLLQRQSIVGTHTTIACSIRAGRADG